MQCLQGYSRVSNGSLASLNAEQVVVFSRLKSDRHNNTKYINAGTLNITSRGWRSDDQLVYGLRCNAIGYLFSKTDRLLPVKVDRIRGAGSLGGTDNANVVNKVFWDVSKRTLLEIRSLAHKI